MKAAIRKPDGEVEYIALLAENYDEATRECAGLEEDGIIGPGEEIIAIIND